MDCCKKLLAKKILVLVSIIMTLGSVLLGVGFCCVNDNVKAAPIVISSAEELKKIGMDSGYPMNGDYVLNSDIDLSGQDWIPIGGTGSTDGRSDYIGIRGDADPSHANVFSGTFDGNGHVISGMTIKLDGSVNGDVRNCGQVGLFSIVGSNTAGDYASVTNLIMTDVNIDVDFSDGFAAVGSLAGELNGYAYIDNIAIVNGTVIGNPRGICDTVGIGGVIGECRTADSAITNKYISITNIYNGADVVASGTRKDYCYAGAIVGRVAKSSCKMISKCLNVGNISYDGDPSYAVFSPELGNADLLLGVSDCYYLQNSAVIMKNEAGMRSAASLHMGAVLPNFSADVWQAVIGCYPVPKMCITSKAAGFIYMSALVPGYATGENEYGVKNPIELPSEINKEVLAWSSSNSNILYISGNKAVPVTDKIGADTEVTLTATSALGYTKSFKLIIIPDQYIKAGFNKKYAVVGEPITAVIENPVETEYQYEWMVGNKVVNNTTDTYIPTKNDLESFISVRVKDINSDMSWLLRTYLSELPVVYINTHDGKPVTDTHVTKNASILVQGNNEFSDEKYMFEGETTIKGRGNSTWSKAVEMGVKKPYKIKLSSKCNLLGISRKGKNKHWVLMANMIDHTNMRNEVTYDLSRELGLEAAMDSTGVVLILNGEYEGMYQLCEHIRIDKNRVDVYNWEDLAEDLAVAICSENLYLNLETLEDALKEDLSFITTGLIQYGGNEYKVSDYYTGEIPDITGGFLFDMDFRSGPGSSKYISSWTTSNTIPMYFSDPEYAITCPEMMEYAKNYINAFEGAIKSRDYTYNYDGKDCHYSELFDIDSLVQYWFICELSNNWDSMKNSTYLYKDIDGKMYMGPAWDYDWGYGNICMYGSKSLMNLKEWHTDLTGRREDGGFAECDYQKYQWNRYLVKDPYFVLKLYNLYRATRHTVFEDLIKDGGVIDTLDKKYATASRANDKKWGFSYDSYDGYAFIDGVKTYSTSQMYDDAVISFKTFVERRIGWFDRQFESIGTLYTSLGGKTIDDMRLEACVSSLDGGVDIYAAINESNVAYGELLVNGKLIANSSSGDYKWMADDNVIKANMPENELMTAGSYNSVQLNLYASDNSLIKTVVSFCDVKDVEEKATLDVYLFVPTNLPPGDIPKPTKKPVATRVPQQNDGLQQDEEPQTTGKPVSTTPAPGGNSLPNDAVIPGGTDGLSNNPNSNQVTSPSDNKGGKVKKTSIKITIKGKKNVKRNKKIVLKAVVKGTTAKVKWKLAKGAGKYVKITKKTGKSITLKAKNKVGKVTITASCKGKSRKYIFRVK